ncbi:hypothetical protein ACP275_03G038400 [Erythranthe tilingii]
MLCACSGEQFKTEEAAAAAPPHSPAESLATRDFSVSGLSSTIDWESKLEDAQVDEAESTLKEALSLNYEEARALLGRLEYQKGNYDAALQVFQGIDIKLLSPRMSKAIAEGTRPRKSRSRGRNVKSAASMSLHSVSLLLEAILLKSKSLAELGRIKESAKECKFILDTVESALPNGTHQNINQDTKLLETFHIALELLPTLWLHAGYLDESVTAYRRALVKPWNLHPQRLAKLQKDLASTLLYSGIGIEESILLLFVLMHKILHGEIAWDPQVMDHLTFALSISGQFEYLANHVEQVLPGVYNRVERWYFLALCYSAAGDDRTALNLLKKVSGFSENNKKTHLPSFLLGAKLCSQDPNESKEGINFARGVINASSGKNEQHMLSQAHKFLGLCYGNLARISVSDFERVRLHRESIDSLSRTCKDPEIIFCLGMENAVQRNLTLAFDRAMAYSKTSGGSSVKGWKLLALVASAEQRLKDAEAIVDVALDETGNIDQLELLRLKAIVQIAQEQPKRAIETYRILLSLVQGNTNEVIVGERRLELEAWLDLAGLYSEHELWVDSDICIKKARSVQFYSPRSWHTTGRLFEAQEQYKVAIVAFSVSLSIDSDYVPSIISTAETLMKMGNKKSIPIAKSFLMNAVRLEPTNHDAWFNLGKIYKIEGLLEQAADSFQAAHELKLSAPVQSFNQVK